MAYLFRTRTDGLGHPVCFDRDYGPYTGHAMDPRTPEDDTPTLDTAASAVCEVIGRACRTFDKAAAVDLLKSAATMLDELCEQIESGEVEL